jgi:uncharacterized protein YcfL
MKFKVLTFYLSFLYLIQFSCSQGTLSTHDHSTDKAQADSQIRVGEKIELGGGLRHVLQVGRVIQSTTNSGVLRTQVDIKNTSSKEVRFSYKFEWLDMDGLLVHNTALVWSSLLVRAGESKMIQSTSTMDNISGFILKIQPAKKL